MKRLLPLLLCLALWLCGCAAPAAQTSHTPAPSASAPPSPAVESATPPVSLEPADPAVTDNARYFFAEGCFLGAWSDGVWRSAADGGFTLGQLFDRDYVDVFGDSPGAVRFYAGEGPGAFDDPERTRRLLEPFGVLEGSEFIMKLPGQLTGDAADIVIPDYGFYAAFDGQTHYLISNASVAALPLTEASYGLGDEALAGLLHDLGVSCELRRCWRSVYTCDLDGDGEAESLELIRNNVDAGGYLVLDEGDDIFYALLCCDGDETEVVTLERMDYTDDPVAHFTPGEQPIVADLDGDGVCEVILRHGEWEWGHYAAFSRVGDGWKQVLRADYGT